MSRKKQIQQLLAVCLFAYLPAILYAVYILLTNKNIDNNRNTDSGHTFTIIYMVLALTLLAKVLEVRGSSFRDLGVTIAWKNALKGIPLAALAYLLYYIVYIILAVILPSSDHHLMESKN